MNDINLNVQEGEIIEKEQKINFIGDDQIELILNLHTEYQIPLFAALYVVIQKDCKNLASVNQVYKNIDPNDHDYIQLNGIEDCAICKQQKSLHHMFTQNYSNLIQMAEVIQNKIKPKIICSVCYEEKFKDTFVYFNNQIHNICEQCFKIYLVTQITNGHVLDLKCPHCNEVLVDEIILKYAQEVKQKYFKFKNNLQIVISTDRMWCPNNKCQKIVIFKTSSNLEQCQYCQTEFCKQCRSKSHPDINCKENISQFIGLSQNNERLVQCPSCKFLIEKVDGCNFMKCSYCDCQWCWGCLKEITFLHGFYCPHSMPCYDEKKCWTKILLVFWYIILFICNFVGGLFFIQIMLFSGVQTTQCYIQSECCAKVMINILISIVGIIIFPLTSAIYLICFIPLCITLVILDIYDGQKLKHKVQAQNVQQIEP